MDLINHPDNIFLLEQLAEQTNKAFFIFNTVSQELQYLSPAFEAIWNRKRTDALYDFSIISATILEEDKAYVLRNWLWYKRPRTENKKNFEFRIITPEGQLKWVCMEVYLLRNEDMSHCLSGWVEEITEEKYYTEVLKKYASKKNATLEILSHDITGFIGLIHNLSQNIITKTASKQDEAINHQLNLIRQTCLECSNLIINLVNHEFVDSANVVLTRTRIDLVQKINNIVEMFRAAEQSLTKTFTLTSSEPVIFAKIDDVKFMQVINNLLSNALKFTPDGGEIKINLAELDDKILISILDSGIGIPDELQPELFERFTPAQRPGLRGEKSVGLGMSIIKAIVELHEGRIWFKSQENKGTIFYIELPKE